MLAFTVSYCGCFLVRSKDVLMNSLQEYRGKPVGCTKKFNRFVVMDILKQKEETVKYGRTYTCSKIREGVWLIDRLPDQQQEEPAIPHTTCFHCL